VLWGEGVSSIRLALTPRSALGLLHLFVLPLGRPRFLLVGLDMGDEAGMLIWSLRMG